MGDLCYIGTGGGFKRSSGDGYTLAAEGQMSGTIIYSGEKSEVNAFLATWPNGRGHPDQPLLRKNGHQVAYRGPRAVVTLNFSGLDPTEAGGVGGEGAKRKTERVKRRALVTKDGLQYYVDYYAPLVTVTWQSGAEPSNPQKQGTSGISSKNIELDIAFVRNPTDEAAVGLPAEFLTEGTDYGVTQICAGFTIEPSGDDYVITELWTLAVYNLE